MSKLYVNDWAEWQSYRKDRGTPPWIKIHRCLMSSAKWAALSDAEKGQLISMWIIAADNDGELPNDARALRKICQLDDPPNIEKFMEVGFLTTTCPKAEANITQQNQQPRDDGCQVDAKLTPRRQPVDAPETETETETETEKKEKKEARAREPDLSTLSPIPEWLDAEVWEGWLAYRRQIRKALPHATQAAQLRKLEEWRKRGHDPTAIIQQSITNGWSGLFEIKGGQNGSHSAENVVERAERARSKAVAEIIGANAFGGLA